MLLSVPFILKLFTTPGTNFHVFFVNYQPEWLHFLNWATSAPCFNCIAVSIDLTAFRSVSGDRWLYLSAIAIDLWPISSRTVNKSAPSVTSHEANE
jgi:hypothetical protein